MKDKQLLETALRFLADLNGGNYLKDNDVASIDMNQRSLAIQKAIYEKLNPEA
jgi:hypothetical protein